MMIFELTDLLKEKITFINEGVLNVLDTIAEKESLQNVSKQVVTTDISQLNYTPVTEETFSIWCEQYKERIRAEKLANYNVFDDKPTGKALFLANRSAFDDMVLESVVEPDATAAVEGTEESKVEEEEDDEEFEEAFVYDAALYGGAEEQDEDEDDIDFDD